MGPDPALHEHLCQRCMQRLMECNAGDGGVCLIFCRAFKHSCRPLGGVIVEDWFNYLGEPWRDSDYRAYTSWLNALTAEEARQAGGLVRVR